MFFGIGYLMLFIIMTGAEDNLPINVKWHYGGLLICVWKGMFGCFSVATNHFFKLVMWRDNRYYPSPKVSHITNLKKWWQQDDDEENRRLFQARVQGWLEAGWRDVAATVFAVWSRVEAGCVWFLCFRGVCAKISTKTHSIKPKCFFQICHVPPSRKMKRT